MRASRRLRVRRPLLGAVSVLVASCTACDCGGPTTTPPPRTTVSDEVSEPVAVATDPDEAGAIPTHLLAQLPEPTGADETPRSPDADDACAGGACALVEDGLITVLEVVDEGDEAAPRIRRTRLEGAGDTSVSSHELPTEGLVAALPSLLRHVERARALPSLVRGRAEAEFSLDTYTPLVTLGGSLAGRRLYAEVTETAYRIHLRRGERGIDRVLVSLPLVATACDGGWTDRACIAPLSIDDAYLAPDGRSLVLRLHHPAAGHGLATAFVQQVPLEDARAVPSDRTPASDELELERSLSAPGPRVRWLADDASRCPVACVRFREDGQSVVVFHAALTRGEIEETRVRWSQRPSEDSVLRGPDVATAIERVLADEPGRDARTLVTRQAIASDRAAAVVPWVELRAPHAGARLRIQRDHDEAVLVWQRGPTQSEVARVPAAVAQATPSIVEVYAPPNQGYPLVVVLAYVASPPDAPSGIAHRLEALVVGPAPERAR